MCGARVGSKTGPDKGWFREVRLKEEWNYWERRQIIKWNRGSRKRKEKGAREKKKSTEMWGEQLKGRLKKREKNQAQSIWWWSKKTKE